MSSETNDILTAVSAGNRSQVKRLFEIVYDDMRDLAHKYLHRTLPDKILQPTDVVHEAFVKLVNQQHVDWRGKSHFFAIGAQAMRHILVDHPRRNGRQKRGAGRRRVPFDDALVVSIRDNEDVLAIDEAIEKLALINEMRAKIVELRFFAGMTVAEVADALGVSKRTIEGHWAFARAWLRRELAEGEEDDTGA